MQGLSPLPPRQERDIYIDPEVPAYKVINKRGFFDDIDTLHPQDALIYWEGEPNMGFEPLNEPAIDKMRAYLEELDRKAQLIAKEKGSGHVNMVNAFEANQRLKDMDRKLGRSVDIEEDIAIMRAKRDPNNSKCRVINTNNVPRMVPMMQAKKTLKKAETTKTEAGNG